MNREQIEANLPDGYTFDDFSREIAEKLRAKYPDLEYVKMNKVAFLRKEAKAKAGRKTKYAYCIGVPLVITAFAGIGWIIVTNGENYTNLPLGIKQKVIYHEMFHVHDEEGKMNKHNIEDFKECINKFGGTDWIVSNEDELLVEMEDEQQDPLNQGPDEFDNKLSERE